MCYEIKADYRQQYLLPPSIEDWVPEDHPARFIRNFVDTLDLQEVGFMEFKGFEGHPYYSSNLLLNVFLYAYFHKNRSLRGMERMCYNDIGAIWLAGNFKPDHNTFWRFFKRNKRALRKVLFQVK